MKDLYNRTRHLELLKLSKEFKNRGKDFYREDYENYVELLNYDAAINEYFCWKLRFKLASIMEEFINGTITGKELMTNIHLFKRKIGNLTQKLLLDLDSEKFQNFNPDFYKLIGFADFIDFFSDEFDDLSDFCNEYQTNEDQTKDFSDSIEFYNSMKGHFLELQKVLDETQVFAERKVFDERILFDATGKDL